MINDISDICTSPMRPEVCRIGSPLREKSYSPKRRISLAHPQQIDISRLNYDFISSPIAEAKLSPRQFQVVGNYDILKTIGKGQFGKVKLARHVMTNDLVAVKVINKKKLDEVGKKIFEMEMAVMKQLSHPNIIRLYEVVETDRFYFLFMEYASGGEVLDYIVMHQSLSEKKARNLFRQIISAISHCHKNSIVHRDLKGENLLLDSNLTIKVIDFGLSNKWSQTSFLKTACGSPLYASPEIIEHKEYVGPEVDIWSMGVLLFVFLTGVPPFEGDDLLTLYNKILSCDYKIPEEKKLSEDCKDILSKILVIDPSKRATMEEIINHPWVKGEDDWKLKEEEESNPPITVDTIDKNLLIQLEYLGYSKEKVINSLVAQKFNSPYAIYYLLQEKQKQYGPGVNTSPNRVLKMGSNPVSSLQRKRIEMISNDDVGGRRRANSECPEFTVAPYPHFPPIHRKRSLSRNETQIRTATSHLVHHTTSHQISHNIHPSITRAKQSYRNEILNDERDEITKRNTDDNILFLRNLKDKAQNPIEEKNNNINNNDNINININNNNNININKNVRMPVSSYTIPATTTPMRVVKGSNASKVMRSLRESCSVLGEEKANEKYDYVHEICSSKLRSSSPMNMKDFEEAKLIQNTVKNLEARRCRSVNVDLNEENEKEKDGASVILNFLNVESNNKTPSHLSHSVQLNNNNNNNYNNNNNNLPLIAQPKQLTELEFEAIKSQMEEEKKYVGGGEPPSNWQSFLSWTKQLLQSRMENDKPRSVRTVFNNDLISNKPPQEILAEIKRLLKKFKLPFEHTSPYSLKAVDPIKKVHFEVEVCQLPKISQMYVRINRIAGKWEDYKELCETVVPQLDL